MNLQCRDRTWTCLTQPAVARAGFQPPFLEVRALNLVSGFLGPQWIPQIGSLALSPLQRLLPILGAVFDP